MRPVQNHEDTAVYLQGLSSEISSVLLSRPDIGKEFKLLFSRALKDPPMAIARARRLLEVLVAQGLDRHDKPGLSNTKKLPCLLLSVGGGDDFPRFSAAGWCVAWEPGPSDPVTSHPKPRFPATLAGAWRGSQVPRTGHLPPEASFPRHAGWRGVWKPGPSDPVTPVNSSTRRAPCLNAPGSRPGHATSLRRPHSRHCRQLSPLTTRLPKNPLPPASFRNVAPFGKRSDRADLPRFYISQILCF